MAKNLFDLRGKVTVVTGGNSGIGLGFARGIARQGGDLAIWARSKDKNAAAQKELESLGARVTTRQVDVTSEQEVAAAFDALIADMGRVDCVFANSGMGPLPGIESTIDLPTEEYHKLMNLNLHGAYYTLREGARHMVNRAKAGEPGGSLVQCGSLSMFLGLKGKAHYAAAKAAMGAVVRCLAVELGPYRIRANCIAPGYIKTGLTDSTQADPVDKFFASTTPIPRVGYPADFEGIAAYLASDASSFHSGDTIVIDGAYLISM
ncbi:MAG TPA: SDR family oxidoreductase [Steroidobacteraceae bacterium]|nr:SDR family oxidoreductase [Steroidobacteraceae bacterium]